MIVAVAGTGTGVGKTHVAAGLLRALRAQGLTVAARKPVQSFAPDDPTTDADILAAASGETSLVVCPAHRRLAAPMAPPMAAAALGLPPFTIADLGGELDPPAIAADVVIVETVGGVRSPIADDGDSAALIEALHPALVLLVADAGLGTINLVRLSVGALRPHRVTAFLNRFDPTDDLQCRNAAWLRTHDGVDVVTDVDALTRSVRTLTGV